MCRVLLAALAEADLISPDVLFSASIRATVITSANKIVVHVESTDVACSDVAVLRLSHGRF